MKTNKVATGILGALAIAGALGLTACGAEVGAPGESEIGSAAQALSNNSPVVSAAATVDGPDQLNPDPDGRIWSASCVVNDAGKLKMVSAGGFKPNGAASNEIFMYEPAAGGVGTWVKLAATLPTARGWVRGVNVPGSTTKCLFIGGRDAITGGNAKGDVDLFEKVGANWVVNSTSNPNDLGTPRSNFEVSTCGSRVVVFGGVGAAILRSIEVANAATPSAAWSGYANALAESRQDFGLDKDPNANRYLAVGGHSSISAQRATIEVITMSTSNGDACTPTGVDTQQTLSNPVEGNKLFFEGSTDHFIAAAGYYLDTSSVPAVDVYPTAVDEITVDWATPTNTTVSQGAYALSTGVYLPTLVTSKATASVAHLLSGGSTAGGSYPGNNPSAASTAVWQYQDTFGTHTAALNTARFGHPAELLSDNAATGAVDRIYAPWGRSFGMTDYLLSQEVITP